MVCVLKREIECISKTKLSPLLALGCLVFRGHRLYSRPDFVAKPARLLEAEAAVQVRVARWFMYFKTKIPNFG
jgi:hypothetical protein